MLKKELRLKYKALRHALSEADLEEMSLQIANQLIKMDIWQHTYYHLFLPIIEQKEVNTEYVLQILAGKDKEIVVSKSNFENKEMAHFLLTDNTKIKKNQYNIPEPVDGLEVPSDKIQVVFVPLLAYDNQGNRVGYGKGFYDVFLQKCKPNVLKIGLSFFPPEPKIISKETQDIGLDFVVTPTHIYAFKT
jgi:5-formyltetrahydrofolate cyclo-ligase